MSHVGQVERGIKRPHERVSHFPACVSSSFLHFPIYLSLYLSIPFSNHYPLPMYSTVLKLLSFTANAALSFFVLALTIFLETAKENIFFWCSGEHF